MDDCFDDHPHDTLEVLRALSTRVQSRQSLAASSTRILGRPGLVQWLMDLAALENRQLGENRKPGRATSSDNPKAAMFTLLHGLVMSSPSYPSTTADESPVYFMDRTNDVLAHESLWRDDSVKASSCMAAWFAAWAASNAHRFRKFVIISMIRSEVREEWKRSYQHLKVLTPGAYTGEERKKEALSKR